MGSRAISGLKLIAIPYPPDAWDGVLGLSYLRNFDVCIDYRRKAIFHLYLEVNDRLYTPFYDFLVR